MRVEAQENPDKPVQPGEHVEDRITHASEREMPCPVCGHPMPDLKGGKDSICPVCGFKDSCCY